MMTLFSFVAILSLAAMGLTYTLWSEDVTIDGTVSTGEVDVAIGVTVEAEDNEEPNKDTGTCAASTSQNANYDGSDGYNQLDVEVTGAYPSYECTFEFTVTNEGTVPVHFAFSGMNIPNWMVDNYDPDLAAADNELMCYQSESGGAETPVTSLAALDDTGQIHEDGWVRCEVKIHFANADDVAENDSIDFGYVITAHQFNENVDSTP